MVRIGFVMISEDLPLCQLAIDLSGDSARDKRMRNRVCGNIQPHIHVDTEVLKLVVLVNVDGTFGACMHVLEFTESVPKCLIRSDMEAIYLLEVLRIRYGTGDIPVGPWSEEESRSRDAPNLIMDSSCGYKAPQELNLLDMTRMSGFKLEDQFRITQHLKMITSYMKPGTETQIKLKMAIRPVEDVPNGEETCMLDDTYMFVPLKANRLCSLYPAASASSSSSKVVSASSTVTSRKNQNYRLTKVKEVECMKVAEVAESLTPLKVEGKFKCPLCDKIFSDRSNCRKHTRIHSKKKLPCSVCGVTFSDPTNYKVHMSRHSQSTGHVCKHCGKVFHTVQDIKDHLKLHERSMPGKIESACMLDICPNKGKMYKDLIQHCRLSHQISTFGEYQKAIRDQLKMFSSASTVCTCENHQVWIYKWVGSQHNCCLCTCVYEFRKVKGSWTRLCKFRSIKE